MLRRRPSQLTESKNICFWAVYFPDFRVNGFSRIGRALQEGFWANPHSGKFICRRRSWKRGVGAHLETVLC